MTAVWLHDLDGERVAALGAGRREFHVDRKLGSSETLYLEWPADDGRADLIVEGCELHWNNAIYRVTEKKKLRRGSDILVSVIAEAIWNRLRQKVPGTVTISDAAPVTGLAQILAYVEDLDPVWRVSAAGAPALSGATTYSTSFDDATVLQMIREWAKVCSLNVEFDTAAATVRLREGTGPLRGVMFRYGRNVTSIERRVTEPRATRLYGYGRQDLNIAGINSGLEYVEDLSWYTSQGVSASAARARHGVTEMIVDQSFVEDTALKAFMEGQLAEWSQGQVFYRSAVVDIADFAAVPDVASINPGDVAGVADEELGFDLTTTVVRHDHYPDEPTRTVVELDTLEQLTDSSPARSRGTTAVQWLLFTDNASQLELRNDVPFITMRIPLSFSGAGEAVYSVDFEGVGVGSGDLLVELLDTEQDVLDAEYLPYQTFTLPYTDGEVIRTSFDWWKKELSGDKDYRVRITAQSTVSDPASGMDIAVDEGRFWILAQGAVRQSPTSPNSERFEYTGGEQTFTAPEGVTEVTMEVAASEGSDGNGNTAGGAGGKVTATFPVVPLTEYTVDVGGRTGTSSAGYPNGGAGAPAEGGGGGGSSAVWPASGSFSDALIVAGGGGGAGESRSGDPYDPAGGIGGYIVGGDGLDGDTNDVPGRQGFGATQYAGGAGSPLGNAGAFNQGGDAGPSDAFQAEGGGGGGGWYGGGGGQGSSGGAGGGGGGSGYVDLALASDVLAEDGANAALGYVEMTWAVPDF